MDGLNGGESVARVCGFADCGRPVEAREAWECVPECGVFCSRECHVATVRRRLGLARGAVAPGHEAGARVLAFRGRS